MAITLEHVRQAVSHRGRGVGFGLFIGAGCSYSAGIPLAPRMTEIIRREYSDAYAQSPDKSYSGCMMALTSGQRQELFRRYIADAPLNWAHICIASLIRSGLVDRVLTPNFDNLLIRSCALLGSFPAVYDMTTMEFRPDRTSDPAIFFIHGQHTGYYLKNLRKELAEQAKTLRKLFDDSFANRVWIVVGYSGQNDPIFNLITSTEEFRHPLYWVGYPEATPPAHVRERLLERIDGSYFISGYDADAFFVKLAQKLGAFPSFAASPFTHMETVWNSIQPLSAKLDPMLADSGSGRVTDGDEDLIAVPRQWIRSAREQFEGGTESNGVRARQALLSGDYRQVIRMAAQDTDADPAMKGLACTARVLLGREETAAARGLRTPEALRRLKVAETHFRAALELNPGSARALSAWGNALVERAFRVDGPRAQKFYAAAKEKYEQALKHDPRFHGALNNWGLALLSQGEASSDETAEPLFGAAAEKFKAALDIDPKIAATLNNWGLLLTTQAGRAAPPRAADRLYAAAAAKYAAAMKLKPDDHEILFNWGRSLAAQARGKRRAPRAALKLFAAAQDKFRQVATLKPNFAQTFHAMGAVFIFESEIQPAEASTLLAKAAECLATAVAIDPQNAPAWDTLGSLKIGDAKRANRWKAAGLFAEAEKLLLKAEEVRPGWAAYNLASLAALRRKEDEARRWLEVARSNGRIPEPAEIAADTDFEPYRDTGWFAAILSEGRNGASPAAHTLSLS